MQAVFGKTKLKLEVAEDKAKGLMDRRSLGKEAGMIFVFPFDSFWPFWMKNVKFPLDLIFIDSKFKIVDIKEGKPNSEKMILSGKPARMVIEANAGFCSKNKIKAGDKVTI